MANYKNADITVGSAYADSIGRRMVVASKDITIKGGNSRRSSCWKVIRTELDGSKGMQTVFRADFVCDWSEHDARNKAKEEARLLQEQVQVRRKRLMEYIESLGQAFAKDNLPPGARIYAMWRYDETLSLNITTEAAALEAFQMTNDPVHRGSVLADLDSLILEATA